MAWRMSRPAGRDVLHGRSSTDVRRNGLETGCRSPAGSTRLRRGSWRMDPWSPARAPDGGAASRGRWSSARVKGVRFILNRHMDEIIREQRFSGRSGIRASYSPRFDPQTARSCRASGRTAASTPRRDDLHQGSQGHRHRRRRSWGQSAVPQHVLPGVGGAFVSSGWALRNAARTPAASSPACGSGQPCRHAAEPLCEHVPFRATSPRDPYRHASGHPFSMRGSTGINLAGDSSTHLIVNGGKESSTRCRHQAVAPIFRPALARSA